MRYDIASSHSLCIRIMHTHLTWLYLRAIKRRRTAFRIFGSVINATAGQQNEVAHPINPPEML